MHKRSHANDQMRNYEEGFWRCVLYRQTLSLRKFREYKASMEDASKTNAMETFMSFRSFGSKLTIGDVFELYDWVEPLPLASPSLKG